MVPKTDASFRKRTEDFVEICMSASAGNAEEGAGTGKLEIRAAERNGAE